MRNFDPVTVRVAPRNCSVSGSPDCFAMAQATPFGRFFLTLGWPEHSPAASDPRPQATRSPVAGRPDLGSDRQTRSYRRNPPNNLPRIAGSRRAHSSPAFSLAAAGARKVGWSQARRRDTKEASPTQSNDRRCVPDRPERQKAIDGAFDTPPGARGRRRRLLRCESPGAQIRLWLPAPRRGALGKEVTQDGGAR